VAVVFLFALLQRRVRRGLEISAIFLIGLVLSAVASKTWGMAENTASYVAFGPRRSMHFLGTVLRHIGDSVHLREAGVVLVAALVVLASRWASVASWLRSLYGLVVLFVVGWLLLFSGSQWVGDNLLHFRYFFPVYLLYAAMVGGAVHQVLDRISKAQRYRPTVVIPIALSVALVAAVVWAVPRVPAVDDVDWIRSVSEKTAVGEQSGVEVVIGPYAPSWAVVFAMRSHGFPVFGVTFRGDVLAGRVRSLANQWTARGQPVRALCMEDSPELCAEEFSSFVGATWVADSVDDSSPWVVNLTLKEV
jgi:hypothetical protein